VQILIVTVKFQPITPEVEDKLNIREIEPLRRYLCFCVTILHKKSHIRWLYLKKNLSIICQLIASTSLSCRND